MAGVGGFFDPIDASSAAAGHERGAWGRLLVASHPHAPAALLAELVQATLRPPEPPHDASIGPAVARNPATPAELLRRLATRVELEQALLENPSLPADLRADIELQPEPA